MMKLPVILQQAGVDAHKLLAEFGLNPAFFEDPDNVISFETAGGIFKRCVERTHCEHFGLLIGQDWGITTLGTLGYLGQSSSTVRSALEAMTSHIRAHDGGAVATLSMDRRFASLSYQLIVDVAEGSEHIVDCSIAIMQNILRGLCGPTFQLSRLQFAHDQPANTRPYKTFFGVTPRFNAEKNSLIFEEAWLDKPLASADPVLHAMMEKRAREIIDKVDENLVRQLRMVLKPLVTSADCTLVVVAKLLGMGTRKLKRRLATYETTFRDIREEVRFETARQLLGHTQNPAYQIADMLGYSDASSFTRAFRRWSGMGPAQWRDSRQHVSAKPARRLKAA